MTRRRSGIPSLGVWLAAGTLLALSLGSAASGHTVRAGALTHCTVGTAPEGTAFNPITNQVYVENAGSGTISIAGAPCKVSKTVSLPSGASPVAAAFDPQDNDIYVVDENLSQVYVLQGSKIVATLAGSAFSSPDGIAFNPGDGDMLVANFGSDNLTGVSGTSVQGWIPVGSGPQGIAYDPYFDTILVTDFLGANVTVIQSATYPFTASHASIPVGLGPSSVIFDPADNLDYVTNEGSHNVSAVTGSGYVYSAVVAGAGPYSVAWDQTGLTFYVANYLAHSVWVYNGTTNAVVSKIKMPAGTYPISLAYDSATSRMYVADVGHDLLYLLS